MDPWLLFDGKMKEQQWKQVEQGGIVTLKRLGKEGDEEEMMEEDWDECYNTF